MWATIKRKPLFWILFAALAVRGAAGVGLQDRLDNILHRRFLIEGDAIGYWVLGRQIVSGQPYEIYTPPRRVLRMPGFPLFLAGAMSLAEAVGQPQRAYLIARLLLAGVGTLACGLVYCLGKQLFDRPTGLLAAALAAFAPAMIGFSVVLLSETLFAATLLASLLVLVRLSRTRFDAQGRQPGMWLSVAAGVSIAVACYVRPTWLLVGPLFAAGYVMTSPKQARLQTALRGGIVLLSLLAALFPWAYRNYRVTGHWVFTTLWVGPSLYDGLHAGATGESDMDFYERDGLLKHMSEYEVDRHYRRLAWQFVADHPVEALRLGIAKLGRFWKPWPNADQFRSASARVAIFAFFVPVLILAAVGWWKCRDNVAGWVWTAGPLLYFSLVHMVFIGSLRYRLPVEYPLCVLSAAGVRHFRRKR